MAQKTRYVQRRLRQRAALNFTNGYIARLVPRQQRGGVDDLDGKVFCVCAEHVNVPLMIGTLSVIEMALGATGVPNG